MPGVGTSPDPVQTQQRIPATDKISEVKTTALGWVAVFAALMALTWLLATIVE